MELQSRKYSIIIAVLLLSFAFFAFPAKGQGCSDAGACSIGSMDGEHETGEEVKPPVFKLSYEEIIGLGEKFTFVSQTAVTVEQRVFKTTWLVVRVPFIFTSGNLGNSTGVGDVLVSVVQQVYKSFDSQLGIMAGGKLRTNNSGFSFAGNPLPMVYQTSLGTYDIIGGIQYMWRSWDFYLAYQHPFGRNQNQYLHPPGETNDKKLYYESAQLKRGDDLAFRIQKSFYLKNRQSLQPGILPIYRIQKSTIIKNDREVVLDGSNGLTLNLYLTYVKKLKNNTVLSLTAAAPVIERSYRADGLTRNFVVSLRFTQMW